MTFEEIHVMIIKSLNDHWDNGCSNVKEFVIESVTQIYIKQLELEYSKKEVRNQTIDDCIRLIESHIKSILGVVYYKGMPETDRALGRTAKNELIGELIEEFVKMKEETE